MKETRRTNYRVEVTPEEPWLWLNDPEHEQHRQWIKQCESIAADIRRHCDGVRYVSVDYDTEETCSHCGSVWEDNPECCEEAIKEWDPTGTGVQP